MVWFNVCLSMFERQALFDALLLPAIENSSGTAITFVLDEGQRPQWERDVWPKVKDLRRRRRQGRRAGVVQDPGGRLVHPGGHADERHRMPAQLLVVSPFMSRRVGRDVPRYIFHVTGHSELIERLVELDREHRLAG